jgi:type VI secretion system protein ImpM
VLRGAWIMEHILATPPAPVPPNVETDLAQPEGDIPRSVRERLALHRTEPSCNHCHGVIDPLGQALESFNAIGEWRTEERANGVPIDSTGQLAPTFEQLLSFQLSAMYDPLVLWWTEGSSIVEPSCMIGAGLPPANAFGAFLDGEWAQHRWRSVPALVNRPPLPADTSLADLVTLRFRSAAATDVGRVRHINQDAFLERPEIGVWVVADGLGGHRDGEVASREVCDALADLAPSSGFDELVEAACERIQQVNDHLLRGAERSVRGDPSGSTVVALLVRGTRCAILWAGDSRVYRWRAGRLECLTHDHSVSEADPVTGRQEAHAITRAVGVAPTLTLDVHRSELRAGDRFILCSDGLTRIVTDAQVQEWMAAPELRAIVDGLIALAMEGGAPDNVTVLVAEAYT